MSTETESERETEGQPAKFTDGQIQLFTVVNLLLFGFIPFFLMVIFGAMGLLYALGVNILALPYTLWYFKKASPRFGKIVRLVFYTAKNDRRVHRFLLMGLFIYIYLEFALQILIPLSVLLLTFIALPVVSYFIIRNFKPHALALWISMVFIPAGIDVFVLSNFAFASNETKETLSYYNKTDYVSRTRGSRGRRTALPIIEFHNGEYQEYLGMRSFSTRDESLANNFVTLTFKTSYCGLTFVSDYEFFYDPRYSRTATHYN